MLKVDKTTTTKAVKKLIDALMCIKNLMSRTKEDKKERGK